MNIFLIGYYGFKNIGDEAILSVLIEQFHNNLYYPRLQVLSVDPERTTREFNVISIKRRNLKQIMKTMRETDVLILGGGGLLQDVTGKGRSALYYLLFVLLAKWHRKKVIFLAQGIGPLRKRSSRWLASFLLKRVDFVSVRENESKKLLRDIGVQGKINLIPDPTVLIKTAPAEKERQKCLGVALRSGFFKDIPSVAAQLDRLISSLNMKIVFFPFQKNTDDKLIEKVRLLMKHSKQTEVFSVDSSREEVLAKIGECQMLIGARLHSLIFAAKKHVPFIGLNYDPKVAAFCHTLGMPWLKIYDMNYLTESVRSLWNQKEPLLKVMKHRLAEWENIAELGMKKCFEYIKS